MSNQVEKKMKRMQMTKKMKMMKIKMIKVNLFKVKIQFNSMEMISKKKTALGTLLLEEMNKVSMT